MIKRIMLIVVFLAMPSCGAWGADKPKDTHFQAAMRLLVAMNSEKALDSSVNQMIDLQIKQQPFLSPYKSVLERFFKKYIGWNALKDDLAKIYQEEFTEKELNEITAFYLTPTGKKAAEKIPAMLRKQAELGARRVQENLGELQKMIREEQARQALPQG